MKHNYGYKKLGMKSSHRIAVLKNLSKSLILNECIHTTVYKAKELRRIIDRIITLGKRGDLHAKRQVSSLLNNNTDLVSKVFKELAPRFKNRPGGYTRILKKSSRIGDNANMAIIQFVDYDYSKMISEKKQKEAPQDHNN